ncbi:galactose mutarotase-like domain-containing protein [Lipomyces arxii]|uniref:galactose mutarotase-like domain-containing protein n=1 Tax=Lipomyces arxii TaxID=56418 RepID=UPI0034CD6DC3
MLANRLRLRQRLHFPRLRLFPIVNSQAFTFNSRTSKMPIDQTETKVVLTSPTDASTSVEILLHGANILSWTVKGEEKLWLSEGAILDGSKAVRGGIPLVFPVFGKAVSGPTAALPQHGVARLSKWEFLGQTSANPLTVQFGLGPENLSDTLKNAWNFDFTLIYTVALGEDTLETSLKVENTSTVDWDFQVLFHTYFKIPDVDKVQVHGLDSVHVVDKVSKSEFTSVSEPVTISSQVDRVYENISAEVSIVSEGKTLYEISRKNLDDVVVWNPWVDASKSMSDFKPETGYKTMICVEAGSVSKWTTLPAGETWEATEKIRALL